MPTWILALALLGPSQSPSPITPKPAPTTAPAEVETAGESSEPEVQPPSVERLLIHGGRIYLGNDDGGAVEALLVEDGRVVAAGPLARLGVDLDEPGLGKIDLKGAVAVPGLQDAHGRIEEYGETLETLDLRGLTTWDDIFSVVAGAAAQTPEGEWVLARGWEPTLLLEGELPTHEGLSEAVPDHPVHLTSSDGSSVLVNRRALVRARLHETLEPPPRIQGGRVVLDEEKFATGLFFDEATSLFAPVLPKVTREDRERRILAAQEKLLAFGLTCVHDMGVSTQALSIYRDLRERGLLRLRIVAFVDGNRGLSEEQLAEYPLAPDAEDQLSMPGIALRLDGTLYSRGAALLLDYADRPGEQGRLRLTAETLTAYVHQGYQAGLQPAITAVGDKANSLALDVIERMKEVDEGFMDLRPRIEHAQIVSTRDMPRFPSLGITPSMQPVHAIADLPVLERRLGGHRAEWAYTWRNLAPSWTRLAFGSDFPISSPDPLLGLHAARTRATIGLFATGEETGDEPLGGKEALAGFTRGPAWASNQEDRRGQLVPGYWADLTVFDVDPIDAEPEALLEGKVLLTIISGRVVFQR